MKLIGIKKFGGKLYDNIKKSTGYTAQHCVGISSFTMAVAAANETGIEQVDQA